MMILFCGYKVQTTEPVRSHRKTFLSCGAALPAAATVLLPAEQGHSGFVTSPR